MGRDTHYVRIINFSFLKFFDTYYLHKMLNYFVLLNSYLDSRCEKIKWKTKERSEYQIFF